MGRGEGEHGRPAPAMVPVFPAPPNPSPRRIPSTPKTTGAHGRPRRRPHPGVRWFLAPSDPAEPRVPSHLHPEIRCAQPPPSTSSLPWRHGSPAGADPRLPKNSGGTKPRDPPMSCSNGAPPRSWPRVVAARAGRRGGELVSSMAHPPSTAAMTPGGRIVAGRAVQFVFSSVFSRSSSFLGV